MAFVFGIRSFAIVGGFHVGLQVASTFEFLPTVFTLVVFFFQAKFIAVVVPAERYKKKMVNLEIMK